MRAALALTFTAITLTNAHAFTIKKYDPHAVQYEMGFVVGVSKCGTFVTNWLASDLIFDWLEAKLGNIEDDANKKHFIAGADAADALMTRNRSEYCAELWARFGDKGSKIPGLILRR